MRLLSLLTLSALFLGGCATSGGVPESAGEDVNIPASEQTVEYREVTGSRIRHRVEESRFEHGPLTAYPVTVYGRDDIERTSETDALDSLRFLDPRFFR